MTLKELNDLERTAFNVLERIARGSLAGQGCGFVIDAADKLLYHVRDLRSQEQQENG